MPDDIIKVLIVDDHPMVRKGLAMFVSGFPDLQLVGEASNASDGLELFRREHPDVVLMDMVMPEQNGAAAIATIQKEAPGVAVIALTSFSEEKLIEAALKAGARGFLYKDVSVDELADAIRQTYRGRTILDPKASDVMLRMLQTSSSGNDVMKAELSDREWDVLRLLAQGLTNKQIAVRLVLQLSTVKQYTSNILSKLNVQSRTEAVATAMKMGLLDK